MAFYKVMVLGDGLNIENKSGSLLAGFYVTRNVFAKNESDAFQKAKEGVVNELSASFPDKLEHLRGIKFTVERCNPVGFVQWLFGRPAGFSFFSE